MSPIVIDDSSARRRKKDQAAAKKAEPLAIVSRAKWGARKVRPARKVKWKGAKRDLRIHHTADSGPVGGADATFAAECSYMRRLQAYHIDVRGYSDIGYSYVQMPSGRVFVGRGFEKVGAHTLDPKDSDRDGKRVENEDIGICFAGTFTRKPSTRESQIAFWQLKHHLQARGVKVGKLRPHHESFWTACPGEAQCVALGLHR